MSLRTTILTSTATALLLSGTSALVAFDHEDRSGNDRRGGYEDDRSNQYGNRNYRSKRRGEQRPFKVYLKFTGEGSDANFRRGRNGNSQRAEKFADLVRYYFKDDAPANVQLTRNKRRADLILKVRKTDYDFDFSVVDRDRKSKKYKSRNRYQGGTCGYYKRAYYDQITARGTAIFNFDIRVRDGNGYNYSYNVNGRESERFRYAQNLTADTNCGRRSVDVYPSRKVSVAFEKGSPSYRRQIRREVRSDVARRLAQSLRSATATYAQEYYNANDAYSYRSGGSYKQLGYIGLLGMLALLPESEPSRRYD